jgi:glyoxylase I family protein
VSDIPIITALAGIPVADIEEAVAWYTQFFDRHADLRPLHEVAEWLLNEGATLQLIERPASAGSGILRLEVADLDAAVALLTERGFVAPAIDEYPGIVRFAGYSDPSGNTIAYVQSLFDDLPDVPLDDSLNDSNNDSKGA